MLGNVYCSSVPLLRRRFPSDEALLTRHEQHGLTGRMRQRQAGDRGAVVIPVDELSVSRQHVDRSVGGRQCPSTAIWKWRGDNPLDLI